MLVFPLWLVWQIYLVNWWSDDAWKSLFFKCSFLHWANCEVKVDISCDEILAEMECYLSVPFFNSFLFFNGACTSLSIALPSLLCFCFLFFSVLVMSKSCNKTFCVCFISIVSSSAWFIIFTVRGSFIGYCRIARFPSWQFALMFAFVAGWKGYKSCRRGLFPKMGVQVECVCETDLVREAYVVSLTGGNSSIWRVNVGEWRFCVKGVVVQCEGVMCHCEVAMFQCV